MSNQFLLWSMLLLPWFTLFFMRKEDIKRFMSVALFTVVTSLIISDMFQTLNIFAVRETIFPLSRISALDLGLIPVVTIWLFKFTYGRFWWYVLADAVMNLGFALLFFPWLNTQGIQADILATKSSRFLITTIHGLLLYTYQMW